MLISFGEYWLQLTTNYTDEPKFLRKLDDKQSFIKQRNSEKDLHKEGCPQGMVPIQKSKVEDHTYFKSFLKSHGGNFHSLGVSYPLELVSFVVLIYIYILELFGLLENPCLVSSHLI